MTGFFYTPIISLILFCKFDELFFNNLSIGIHIFNVLDQYHITDAFDGIQHNAETARVWFDRKRWWHVSAAIEF
ncbi:MAG: hypothetical protein K9J16_14185 [Melioribacteraceae bacterium]|nr:hypothetical protein [Melioribacteraceae bacterium]MCF8355668.1 hypothetical protein [Melioribacteraceae bacterium]MCF8395130.1 hypothetical protein [Melioribacteraceae bacterium]